MITIGGSAMPAPSDYSVKLRTIENVATNANGGTIVDVIATKRDIEFGYKYLSEADLATLLTAISGASFTVQYPDPEDGALKTGTFKKGDRSAAGIDYQGGVMRWKDIKFTLNEM